MPKEQKYLIQVFARDMVGGKRTSCGKYETSVEKNNVLYVDLPKDLPELCRIEIEFFGPVVPNSILP